MGTGDAAVTLLVAEYEALHASVAHSVQARQTLCGLALTLSGALLAFGISQDLVAAVIFQPIVASALGLLYAGHVLEARDVTRYLGRVVAVRARELARDEDAMRLDSWVGAATPASAVAAGVVFVLTSALSLATVAGRVWGEGRPGSSAVFTTSLEVRGAWVVALALTLLNAITLWVVHSPSTVEDWTRTVTQRQPGRAASGGG